MRFVCTAGWVWAVSGRLEMTDKECDKDEETEGKRA